MSAGLSLSAALVAFEYNSGSFSGSLPCSNAYYPIGHQYRSGAAISRPTRIAALSDVITVATDSVTGYALTKSGAVYVFTRSGATWTQQAYLKPAAVGTSQQADNFGWSVAVSGDTVVVGAPGEASSTTGVNSTPNEISSNSGAAYVFTRNGDAWSQQAKLVAADAAAGRQPMSLVVRTRPAAGDPAD